MSKIVIKNREVRIEARSAATCGGKQVELLEQAGVVHAIQLRCSCGETTVLELEYAAPPKDPVAGKKP